MSRKGQVWLECEKRLANSFNHLMSGKLCALTRWDMFARKCFTVEVPYRPSFNSWLPGAWSTALWACCPGSLKYRYLWWLALIVNVIQSRITWGDDLNEDCLSWVGLWAGLQRIVLIKLTEVERPTLNAGSILSWAWLWAVKESKS